MLKGQKHTLATRKKMSKSHTGVKLSIEHRKAQGLGRLGDKNPAWKGDRVSYSGIHHWVANKLGKPKTCKLCGKSGFKVNFIDWANISGKYKRDINDWIRLCRKCHIRFDGRKHGI